MLAGMHGALCHGEAASRTRVTSGRPWDLFWVQVSVSYSPGTDRSTPLLAPTGGSCSHKMGVGAAFNVAYSVYSDSAVADKCNRYSKTIRQLCSDEGSFGSAHLDDDGSGVYKDTMVRAFTNANFCPVKCSDGYYVTDTPSRPDVGLRKDTSARSVVAL